MSFHSRLRGIDPIETIRIQVNFYLPFGRTGHWVKRLTGSRYGHCNLQVGPIIYDCSLGKRAGWYLADDILDPDQLGAEYPLVITPLPITEVAELLEPHARTGLWTPYGPHNCIGSVISLIRKGLNNPLEGAPTYNVEAFSKYLEAIEEPRAFHLSEEDF